ncbi:TniQ family protein [Pseudomonas mosselii]|nr:TniQ family protein [Pseudomonas mosselii]
MERILTFPEPLPDETMYSLAVRYHRIIGNSSYRRTSDELFGYYSRTCGSMFPCGLKALAYRLGGMITASDLILHHTLLPLYRPFLSERAYSATVQSMMSNNGSGVMMRLGLTASGLLKHSSLRYCPACVLDDLRSSGVPYWHRIHVAPGVLTCPLHDQLLISYKFEYSNDWRYMVLPGEGNSKPRCTDSPAEVSNTVSHLQNWGLRNPDLLCEIVERGILRFCLAELGFINNGRLCERALSQYLKHRLSMGPSHGPYEQLVIGHDWVLRLLRPRERVIQPFHFFFALSLLGQNVASLKAFQRSDSRYTPRPDKSGSCVVHTSPSITTNSHRADYQRDKDKKCHERAGYNWLYRYDRAWLVDNVHPLPPTRARTCRADWGKRDEEFLSRMLAARHLILLRVGKPSKITKSELARTIPGGSGLLRNIAKLKKSSEMLPVLIENEHDFQLRKLQWAIENLPYPKFLQHWLVIKLAGIRVSRFDRCELQELIDARRLVNGVV